jgi:hypothetical protein
VSHDGATSVFELDFGGGHKVITFVTWADPDLLSRRPEREERH